MKVSFRAMRNMGNTAEYFMFFKWKSKILVCLCIFYKKRKLGSKIRAFFFLLIVLIQVEKKICLLRLTEIPWSFPGKLLSFQRNRGAPGGLRGVIFAGYVPLASQSPQTRYQSLLGKYVIFAIPTQSLSIYLSTLSIL